MTHGPDLGLQKLFDYLAEHPGQELVLATVIETEGSTYRKPGAMVLLTPGDEVIGLVSGGCLEPDLVERATPVRDTGHPRCIEYDLRDDDPLWGLGLGCRGRMRLLLQHAHAGNGFAGLTDIQSSWRHHQRVDLVRVIGPDNDDELGRWWVTGPGQLSPFVVTSETQRLPGGATRVVSDGRQYLSIPVFPPPRLLLCGAGPDAVPLAENALLLGWEVIVYDHREAFADPGRFPARARVVCGAPEALAARPWLAGVDAAVVMSHHLERDGVYTRTLSGTAVAYVGLLGPAERGRELLARIPEQQGQRFFSPAGLDIGSDTPESIALAIVAEAHAVLRGRGGQPLDHSSAQQG